MIPNISQIFRDSHRLLVLTKRFDFSLDVLLNKKSSEKLSRLATLLNELSGISLSHPSEYGNLESIVVKALETNAPTKTRIVRANNKPHVTKELRRAMTRRSRLKKLLIRVTERKILENIRIKGI